jgi:hypothetical protein
MRTLARRPASAPLSRNVATQLFSYQFIVSTLDPGPRRAAVSRLRDVYLEAWGSPRDLREPFRLAVWVPHVLRALNIDRGNDGASSDILGGRREIVTLLRAWDAKRALVRDGDDFLFSAG